MEEQSKKSGNNLIIAFVVLGIVILAAVGIYAYQASQDDDSDSDVVVETEETNGDEIVDEAATEQFTLAMLANFDGQDGNRCYAAVDGIVYDLTESSLWQDGEHTTSGGRATCGGDMSEVILQSPHGKSTLTRDVVEQVGILI